MYVCTCMNMYISIHVYVHIWIYYTYDCFACQYGGASYVFLLPTEDRRGHQIAANWSYYLWAIMWMLRVERRADAGATSVFKHRVNALAPGFVLTSDTWTHVCFFLSLRVWDTWLCMCVYLQALTHICPWLKAYTDVSKCLWIQNAHYEQNRWSFNYFI